MDNSGYQKKLSFLYAVLCAVAALTILILSVTPSFSLGFSTPAGTGLSTYITAYGILSIVILFCLSVICMRQMYKPGGRWTLSVLHASVTVTVAISILALSVMPPLSPGPGVVVNSGAFLHSIAYGTLCFLICMWLRFDGSRQSPLIGAFFFSSLYGLLIEGIQFLLPYRSFEMTDIIFNCLAAATAIVPGYAVMRYIPLYKKTILEQEITFR